MGTCLKYLLKIDTWRGLLGWTGSQTRSNQEGKHKRPRLAKLRSWNSLSYTVNPKSSPWWSCEDRAETPGETTSAKHSEGQAEAAARCHDIKSSSARTKRLALEPGSGG